MKCHAATVASRPRPELFTGGLGYSVIDVGSIYVVELCGDFLRFVSCTGQERVDCRDEFQVG